MKLYTEEQVRKMLLKKLDSSRIWLDDDLINSMTPIELPSDEEINIASKNNSAWEYNNETNFKLGARYITDKILKKCLQF